MCTWGRACANMVEKEQWSSPERGLRMAGVAATKKLDSWSCIHDLRKEHRVRGTSVAVRRRIEYKNLSEKMSSGLWDAAVDLRTGLVQVMAGASHLGHPVCSSTDSEYTLK